MASRAGTSISASAPDQELADTIRPTVEEAIKLSVVTNPRILADALFPAIGPAIRLAVSATLHDMLESISRILDRALSLRGLRWRWEAFRTGKSFGEIALLHNLVYRVEQVLLIHKETGLLIHEAAAESVTSRDSDVIAGMLTAIQDFARDSFSNQDEAVLNTMKAGDLTLWVEQGPQAAIACVIRGNPHPSLRYELQNAVQQIHAEFGKELLRYDGDSSPFITCDRHVKACLQVQYQLEAEPDNKKFLFMMATAVVLLAVWFGFSIRRSQQWNEYLAKLASRPGIVVTSSEQRGGKYLLSGLRDPLSDDPASFLSAAEINPEKVESRWEPYLSLSPEIINARAIQALQPPASVGLEFNRGQLRAIGSASSEWIARSKRLASTLTGVQQYHTQDLINTDWNALANALTKTRIEFAPGVSHPHGNQRELLRTAAQQILEMKRIALTTDESFLVKIVGSADRSGLEQMNQSLSQNRAVEVQKIMIALGVPEALLTTVGGGTQEGTRTASFTIVRTNAKTHLTP